MAKPKRPRDVKQLAKLILDITTGERPKGLAMSTVSFELDGGAL